MPGYPKGQARANCEVTRTGTVGVNRAVPGPFNRVQAPSPKETPMKTLLLMLGMLVSTAAFAAPFDARGERREQRSELRHERGHGLRKDGMSKGERCRPEARFGRNHQRGQRHHRFRPGFR